MNFKTTEELEAIGITISFIADDHVMIRQNELINQCIYTNKQLFKIARQFYPDKKIKPVVFHFDRNSVTVSWIVAQMELHKVIVKDLVRQLPITKEDINAIIKGERAMTATEKGLFFYYFNCYKTEATLPQDELTEKMHEEFTISPEAELRIKVELALDDMKEYGFTLEDVMKTYGLTEEEMKQYKA